MQKLDLTVAVAAVFTFELLYFLLKYTHVCKYMCDSGQCSSPQNSCCSGGNNQIRREKLKWLNSAGVQNHHIIIHC